MEELTEVLKTVGVLFFIGCGIISLVLYALIYEVQRTNKYIKKSIAVYATRENKQCHIIDLGD